MGKAAVLTVVTLFDYLTFCGLEVLILVQVSSAKFSLVFVRMIKLLDPVVTALASITFRAYVTKLNVGANL